MEVRVLPEYDQHAVLVIVGFSLPADTPLPATLKLPIPAGATIAGIGEIDPNGAFKYNYANSYPAVEAGSEWDIATIEVQDYRQVQIDYYYDPGLPQEAGQRSFPLLVQMPEDVDTLVLHVQQPAGATDFGIQPAVQASGQADDGYTYSVATYSDVKAGSTLGYVISYYKPDGTLSIESGQSGATQFSTTTVLLAAILAIVVIVGGFVVYRMYSSSRNVNRRGGRPGAKRNAAQTPPPIGTKRQRQADNASKNAARKAEASKSATKRGESPKGAKAEEKATGEPAATQDTAEQQSDAATEQADEDVEYCTACGEELTKKSRFCPNCGEAQS